MFSFAHGRVVFKKELIDKHPYKNIKWTYVHVVRDDDDVTLYSHERSSTKTWRKPCPLNLKWDRVKQSQSNIRKAIDMLQRDLDEKLELNMLKNREPSNSSEKARQKYGHRIKTSSGRSKESSSFCSCKECR